MQASDLAKANTKFSKLKTNGLVSELIKTVFDRYKINSGDKKIETTDKRQKVVFGSNPFVV